MYSPKHGAAPAGNTARAEHVLAFPCRQCLVFKDTDKIWLRLSVHEVGILTCQ